MSEITIRDFSFFTFGMAVAYFVMFVLLLVQLPSILGAVHIESINIGLNETTLVEEMHRLLIINRSR